MLVLTISLNVHLEHCSDGSAQCRQHNWAMRLGRRLSIVMLTGAVTAVLCGCAARPRLRGQVTLHLMADRDFAQILLAHCESGIELAGTIASLKVSTDIAALAATMRLNEENDRAAILSWIASQSAQPSAVGNTHGAETRTSHAVAIEQLRSTDVAHLNEHALRVLVSHHNEELTVIRITPVEDRNLRRTVEAIRRRLSDEVEALSRRLPGSKQASA